VPPPSTTSRYASSCLCVLLSRPRVPGARQRAVPILPTLLYEPLAWADCVPLGPSELPRTPTYQEVRRIRRCWSSCALFLDLVSGRSYSETWEGCIVSPTAPTKWRSSAGDRGGRSRGGTTIPGSLGGRDSARDSDRLPQGRLSGEDRKTSVSLRESLTESRSVCLCGR
jgi:hypothetical protein